MSTADEKDYELIEHMLIKISKLMSKNKISEPMEASILLVAAVIATQDLGKSLDSMIEMVAVFWNQAEQI